MGCSLEKQIDYKEKDFEMKRNILIKQLKEIATMSKTELIDFNCTLSISNLDEKYKKPLNTCCTLRMAELCEISDIDPLAVMSELPQLD